MKPCKTHKWDQEVFTEFDTFVSWCPVCGAIRVREDPEEMMDCFSPTIHIPEILNTPPAKIVRIK